MQRLLRKLETAKTMVPHPVRLPAKRATRFGAIYYGSTSVAMDEALASLEAQNLHLDTLRIRAFHSQKRFLPSSDAHDQIFVVEQNRDAQMQETACERMRYRSGRALFPSFTMTARRSPPASLPARSRSA